jgi:hypothetical protein
MPSRRQCHTHVDGAPSRLPGRSDRGLSRLFSAAKADQVSLPSGRQQFFQTGKADRPPTSFQYPVSYSTKDLPPSPKRTVQTCFVLPITSPRTLLQSILASSSSSTSPQTTTLSPLTRYRPCGCSVEGSSSPCSRMIRSIVSASTRFVTWSQETSVPVRVRPSTVRMRTFSVGLSAASSKRWGDHGVMKAEENVLFM